MKRQSWKRGLIGAATLALAASPAWAGDPFSNLADTITSAGARWAPALMVLGALCAGGSIVMGSHESGKWAKNFLMGGAGAAILGKVQSIIGGF
jgi:hypothetical protein